MTLGEIWEKDPLTNNRSYCSDISVDNVSWKYISQVNGLT